MGEPAGLDLGALAHLADELESSAVALSIARTYLDLLDSRITRVERALEAGDADVAADAALSLTVTSATIGATDVQRLAASVHEAVQADDLPAATAAVNLLRAAQDSTVDSLRAVLDGPAAAGLDANGPE